MEIELQRYQLAPLVFYDDYDDCGYLLDMKRNALVELNERDTRLLSAILHNVPLAEVLQQFDRCAHLEAVGETDVLTLLERLADQKLLEQHSVPDDPSSLTIYAAPGEGTIRRSDHCHREGKNC